MRYGLRRYKAVSSTDSELYVLRRVEGLRVVSEIGSQTLQVYLFPFAVMRCRARMPAPQCAPRRHPRPTHRRRSCERTRPAHPTSETRLATRSCVAADSI